MVLLVLESDVVCTCLNGLYTKKVQYFLKYDATKPEVIENGICKSYWLPERYIKRWYDTPAGESCLCKNCGLGEEWRSDIAVSRTLSKCPYVQYANTRFRNTSESMPLTRISIDVAENSVLPLLFRRSVNILSCCHIINICGGHQDMKLRWTGPMAYHPYTGFHYFKFLTYLSHEFCSFSNISGLDLEGEWVLANSYLTMC
jgi:hypothetical protein